MATKAYQVSDLSGSKRREFLDRAKGGRAALRDADGSMLVMVPEAAYESLEAIAESTAQFLAAQVVIATGEALNSAQFGALAWLSEFGRDDQESALEDLRNAIARAIATHSAEPIRETRRHWEASASALLALRRHSLSVVSRPALSRAEQAVADVAGSMSMEGMDVPAEERDALLALAEGRITFAEYSTQVGLGG